MKLFAKISSLHCNPQLSYVETGGVNPFKQCHPSTEIELQSERQLNFDAGQIKHILMHQIDVHGIVQWQYSSYDQFLFRQFIA